MPDLPHIPCPPARLKALHRLHAVAKRRGFNHDGLHEVCQCASLSELTIDELHRHASRLEADHPTPGYRPRHARGRKPLAPGEVRLNSDATTGQRSLIMDLFNRLGWSPGTRRHWLFRRYQAHYDRLLGADQEHIARPLASRIIVALEAALGKSSVIGPRSSEFKTENRPPTTSSEPPCPTPF